MMRALYIIALVLGLGYVISAIGFTAAVSSLRSEMWMNDLNSILDSSYDEYSSGYSYGGSDYLYEEIESVTQIGAIVMVVFLAFFEVLFVLSLMKIKTKTMKVISIIGLSLNAIMLVWAVLPAASPSSVYFDEVGIGFIAFGFVLLAFTIIGAIHAFKTKS